MSQLNDHKESVNFVCIDFKISSFKCLYFSINECLGVSFVSVNCEYFSMNFCSLIGNKCMYLIKFQ